MGYNTYYYLEAFDPKDLSTNIIERFNGIAGECDDLSFLAKIGWEGDLRWYDHAEDMENFSKANPGIIFQLTGYGEETGDIWRMWFFNGRVKHYEVVIELPEADSITWEEL